MYNLCMERSSRIFKVSDFYGNGHTDGTFVYCGFKPRWIMMTRSDTAGYIGEFMILQEVQQVEAIH